MDTTVLTTEQRKRLMNALAEVKHQDGDFAIEVEVGGDISIEAKGSVMIEGYQEDGYHNGTGAWIETYRSASVELKATVYSEDWPEETAVDDITEHEAYIYLNRG